jgi:hypothetical protein
MFSYRTRLGPEKIFNLPPTQTWNFASAFFDAIRRRDMCLRTFNKVLQE